MRGERQGYNLFIGAEGADTVSASPEPIIKILPAWEDSQLCGRVIKSRGICDEKRMYAPVQGVSRDKLIEQQGAVHTPPALLGRLANACPNALPLDV